MAKEMGEKYSYKRRHDGNSTSFTLTEGPQ